MIKIRIKTKDNSFFVDNIEYQKGTLTVNHGSPTGISIAGKSAKINEIECNGQVFSTKQELTDWISDNLFRDGGGSTGEGVQEQLSSVSGAGWSFASSGYYSYDGSGTTKSLPVPGAGQTYFIKNRGTGVLNISGNIYLSSSVESVSISPGDAIILHDDGDFWTVQ